MKVKYNFDKYTKKILWLKNHLMVKKCIYIPVNKTPITINQYLKDE